MTAAGGSLVDVLFVVTKPDSKRKTFSVQLPILVGRSEEAKFRIQQDRVSRRHCEFFAQDGGVFLRDLGSTNGTFLNGELVETSAKCPLESGAVVRVGSLEFRVEFTEVDAARQAPVAEPEPAGDRTVGVHPAPDTERLQDEHADADLPAVEVASTPPADSPEPGAGDMAFLTAERPATTDEAPVVEVVDSPDGGIPANEPTAPSGGDGFGFLGEPDASSSKGDDEQLGDFLKGLG